MAEKRPSPRLDVPDDEIDQHYEKTPAGGVWTAPVVQRKIEEAKEETLVQVVRSRLVTLALTGGFSIATMSGVAFAYGKLVDTAKDAGAEAAKAAIAPAEAQGKGTEARVTVVEQQRAADRSEFNARFERLEAGQNRSERKLDKLLDRLDVPNPTPAPPPAKDGGH